MARKANRAELDAAITSDWQTRAQIAAKLGKKNLNPSETKYLEELVKTGAIRREIQTVGITEAFLYKKLP